MYIYVHTIGTKLSYRFKILCEDFPIIELMLMKTLMHAYMHYLFLWYIRMYVSTYDTEQIELKLFTLRTYQLLDTGGHTEKVNIAC